MLENSFNKIKPGDELIIVKENGKIWVKTLKIDGGLVL